MKPIFTNLDRQFGAIEAQIQKLDSPVMRDIANQALSRISRESTRHAFEDDLVKAEMFGFPSENVVKAKVGQWRLETKYQMYILMQRKSDGHVIFSEVGLKNRATARRNSHNDFSREALASIQGMPDLEELGMTSEVSKWARSEHLASQVGADRIKRGRVSLNQSFVWSDVLKTIDIRASSLIKPDMSNRLLSFKRRSPRGFYGLTEEELTEVEHLPGGHMVVFEFEAMADHDKNEVDQAVYDLVSNRFHEDFMKITDLKSLWLSERMMNLVPEHALGPEEFEKVDLAVANFIVGGKTPESIRNRLQFAQMFNFEANHLENLLQEGSLVSHIDGGAPLRNTIAGLFGYEDFSKKEFAALQEYCAKAPGYTQTLPVSDAASLVKLPPEYRPTTDEYMKSVFIPFAHANQNAAKNSIANATRLLSTGDKADKKEALQSLAWIKGGEWDQALKKMDNYPNANNLSDYYMMLEKLLNPVFAHIHYTVDPDSMEFNWGNLEATYNKPWAMNSGVMSNTIEKKITSFPSLLLQNDKLHKNLNVIMSRYQSEGDYSPAKVSWEPLFKEPQEVDGYTFVPLSNGADIVNEGSIMNHCVASYLQPAMAGHTFIVSVQKNGERQSTMELNQDSEGEWTIGQHYGKGNSEVSLDLEEVGMDLVDQMNEGEIEFNTATGMQEKLRDMNIFKASSIAEGFDITSRDVATGLLQEAINYLPKGVSLVDLFADDEKHFVKDLEDILANRPIQERVVQTDDLMFAM